MHRIVMALRIFFLILLGRRLGPELRGKLFADDQPRQLPPPRVGSPAGGSADWRQASGQRLEDTRQQARQQGLEQGREEGRQQGEQGGALLMLAMLQHEGRLLDFLQEGLEGYSDQQIGAAVRDIHAGCRRVVSEHVTLTAVLDSEEGKQVEVAAGFDAARIRLIGNVVGAPPFRGTLKHHGWQAAKVSLPRVAAELDRQVLAPAEVEIP
jgi:hypothetical protein